jgi:hypothetical protein
MSNDDTGAAEAPVEARATLDDFRIAHGGPFYELQRQLGLLHERALRTAPRALLFVGLAWGVPLLLSALAGNALGSRAEGAFLTDLATWARFVVAIGVFVAMERIVDDRLRVHLRQFVRAPLLAPTALPAAAEAVTRGLRRLGARSAELVCLVAAAAITVVAVVLSLDAETSSWLITAGPEGSRPTLAGWWVAFVSNPLFWFLLLRWLWRHLVWALMLRELAGLELRLVASHPDGNGGLAFVGQYPNAFAAFVFGVSSVLGASIAHLLLDGELATATYGYVMAAWLLVVMVLFAAPLMAFTKPLEELKEATLLTASAAATRHLRAAERDLLGRNMAAAADADDRKTADLPNASSSYAAATKLSTYLFSRAAVVPVGAAALLPLIAGGATQLPFKELFQIAKRLLLL